MFEIGTIIRAATDQKALFPGCARLVCISRDGRAWLIRIDTEKLNAPYCIPISDLHNALKAGQLLSDLKFDMGLPASENQLSTTARERMQKNYDLMEPTMADDCLIYDSEYRSRIFKKIAKKSETSVRTLRRLFYRFLAGGMVKLALAPTYKNCGNPGGRQAKGTGRRGPKAKLSQQSEVALPDVLDYLEKGARKYYFSGKETLEGAYIATLKDYFPMGFEYIETPDGTKKLAEIILPPPLRPTYMQFRYVCEKIEEKEGKRLIQPHRIRQKKKSTHLHGSATWDLSGPGARYEIDATKLQIQLVSRYGSAKLIGTPTLYTLIDVWSTAYVGYALSLENAGWPLAAKALHCAFQEKEELFKRLGLPYTNDDWPCCHLPTRLTADRGEFISNKVGLVPELGIKLEITESMCPEAKGSIEAAIKDVKHGRSLKLPGEYPKMPGRRESDGKAHAALTLDQLETIIVRHILRLNNAPVARKRIPPQMLQQGQTNITRIGLFQWGLTNRPGYTRKLTAKEVYTNLLSTDVASVTPKGILYKSEFYYSDILLEKGYLAKAINGYFQIEIRFDEHLADHVWFLDENNNDWVIAEVLNDDISRLKIAFFELEQFNATAKQLIEKTKFENIHQRQENEKLDKVLITEAVQKAKTEKKGLSRSMAKKQIRKNKQVDQEAERFLEGEYVIATYSGENSDPMTKDLKTDEKVKTKKTITALSEELWLKQK